MRGWIEGARRVPTEKKYVGSYPLLGVVLHVAADHGAFEGSVYWLSSSNNPKSSSHFIINNATGAIVQMASIYDRTWANGLYWIAGVPFSPAARRPIVGDKRAMMWSRITPGLDPNKVTISIERSGDPSDVWGTAAMDALIRVLKYISDETGLVYVAGYTLVGHRHIDPVGKAFCPGVHYDFDRISNLVNGDNGETDTDHYVTTTANMRKEPTTKSAVVKTLDVGSVVSVQNLISGEMVKQYGTTSDLWAKTADGYVWYPLLSKDVR